MRYGAGPDTRAGAASLESATPGHRALGRLLLGQDAFRCSGLISPRATQCCSWPDRGEGSMPSAVAPATIRRWCARMRMRMRA
ncbi:hypothetical protein BJF90_35175 [Pseudonocardia sp. CNS-004]|nr:hypothetical protein BJF90_35175 [Pseudonocardia sp. CNS-004]